MRVRTRMFATRMNVGPVSVEFDELTKSTWNFQRTKLFEFHSSNNGFGAPEGGGVVPSRSEGRRLRSAVRRVRMDRSKGQRSGGAGEQREEMAAGAREYEQMPDEMGVTHPFVDEK